MSNSKNTVDRPLGAQISHMLKDRGVEVIFGIPGVHNQEMYRGIEEAGLTHVLARHEQGVGFMADGYARATGRPGVAYVITGPGLCNIMTPLGQAYSDSVPLLVISSCLDEVAARKGQLHQMKDQRAAAETVSEWSEEARTAAAAYGLIDRALSEIRTGRARPRHIQVPIRALEAIAPAARPAQQVHKPASVDAAAVAGIGAAIRGAKRPLMILGGGARGVGQGLAQALRRDGIASFTTYAGRGLVPQGDPLCFGSTLARPSSAGVIGAADMILAVGTDLAEVDVWRDRLGHTVPMVQVNTDPEAVNPAEGPVVLCDAPAFLNGLGDWLAATPRTDPTLWTGAEVAAFRLRARSEVDGEYPGVLRVADALRACLPAGTMIYSDMTQFAYASKEVWDMDAPGHWHHPFGFGTLGYALPAAIGGAVARKGQPTLAIAGDYGFQYTLPELGVAVELGLPLPVVVWDNGKLGAIEASMIRAQIAPNAVVARNPDFLALARAYGAHAEAPASLAGLSGVMERAFAADRPTLIRLTPDIAD